MCLIGRDIDLFTEFIEGLLDFVDDCSELCGKLSTFRLCYFHEAVRVTVTARIWLSTITKERSGKRRSIYCFKNTFGSIILVWMTFWRSGPMDDLIDNHVILDSEVVSVTAAMQHYGCEWCGKGRGKSKSVFSSR
jgi:hypothetical protein